MTNQVIPDKAVLAAALSDYGEGDQYATWETEPDEVRVMYLNDARRALEAAAPHMLIHVHHHDIEHHARSYNEGYEAAMAQMVEE